MHWNQQHQKTASNMTTANASVTTKPVSIVSPTYPPPNFEAPVPPPRAKRLSQTLNEDNSYETNMNGYSR